MPQTPSLTVRTMYLLSPRFPKNVKAQDHAVPGLDEDGYRYARIRQRFMRNQDLESALAAQQLPAQAVTGDGRSIPLNVILAEISQQTAAAANELKQTAA